MDSPFSIHYIKKASALKYVSVLSFLCLKKGEDFSIKLENLKRSTLQRLVRKYKCAFSEQNHI